MSLEATNYVMRRKFGNQTRKLLMIIIADFAGETGESWPSIDTLAARAECSRRSVQEHLQRLALDGELEIIPNAGRGGTNLYRIVFKISEGLEKPEQRVQELHGGVQMSAAQTTRGGANERRPFAPESLGTSLRTSEEREEGATLAADLRRKVNSLRAEWAEVPGWTAAEAEMGRRNRECLESIPDAMWRTMREYLAARHPEGSGAWLVTSRVRFLETPSDLATKARDWRRKHPLPLAVVPTAPAPASEPPATPECVQEMLGMFSRGRRMLS
jgi:hypothetical protein